MARTKGSKNRDYAFIEEIPARCPKCGSAELVTVKSRPVRHIPYGGLTRSGVAYVRIEIRIKVCPCGQNLAVKRYIPAVAAL